MQPTADGECSLFSVVRAACSYYKSFKYSQISTWWYTIGLLSELSIAHIDLLRPFRLKYPIAQFIVIAFPCVINFFHSNVVWLFLYVYIKRSDLMSRQCSIRSFCRHCRLWNHTHIVQLCTNKVVYFLLYRPIWRHIVRLLGKVNRLYW